MRLRVGLVVVATWLGFAAIGLPASPAVACSCAPVDPIAGLGRFPAAFVGTFVHKVEAGDSEAIYIFTVEEWAKGNLGGTVGVRAPRDGGGCGYEFRPGQRMATFLDLQDGQAVGGLCYTVDPDELLRAAEPLVFDGIGPSHLLVGGRFTEGTHAVLDAAGGLLDVIGDPESGEGKGLSGSPQSFHPCPHARLLVELWGRDLVVRDLDTLAVVKTIDLSEIPDSGYWVHDAVCRDERAESIWLRAGWMGGRFEELLMEAVPEPRTLMTTLLEHPISSIDLGPTLALLTSRDGVWLADPPSDPRVLHRTDRSPAADTLAVSAAERPGGGVIAVLEVRRYQTDNPTSILTVYDTSGAELARRTISDDVRRATWIDDERLLLRYSEESRGPVVELVDAASLDTLVFLEGWRARPVVVDGHRLYGLDNGRLLRADLESGAIEELRVFAGLNSVEAIALLDRGADAPEPTPEPTATTTAGGVAQPEKAATDDGSAILALVVIAGVVATGAIALTVAVIRSRRR